MKVTSINWDDTNGVLISITPTEEGYSVIWYCNDSKKVLESWVSDLGRIELKLKN